MPSFTDAVTEDAGGVLLSIEVTAGAKADSFPSGYNEWRKSIACRVASPAVEGRANKAVIALVASTLGISPSAVSIRSGATSSQKKIQVLGLTKGGVLAILNSGWNEVNPRGK